jgi:hypothetical protein
LRISPSRASRGCSAGARPARLLSAMWAGQDAHAEESLTRLLCEDSDRLVTTTLKLRSVPSLSVSQAKQYGVLETRSTVSTKQTEHFASWRLHCTLICRRRLWPELLDGGASPCGVAPAVLPQVGARVAAPHRSTLRLAVRSLADLDTRRQHRTFHLLIKPDILTCYKHKVRSKAD